MDNIEETTNKAQELIKGLLKDPRKYQAVKDWMGKYSFILKKALKLSDKELQDLKDIIEDLKEKSDV